MPESVLKPENANQGAVARGIRWDAVAAIIASFIGLLALLVAGYTAYVQRQQTRAQVWPRIEILASDLLPSNYVKGSEEGGLVLGKGGRIMVTNKGVGPAIIERAEVEVNGRPQPDWVGLLHAFGVTDVGSRIVFTFSGEVVPPNEIINVFAMPDQQVWAKITNGMQSGAYNVVIKACYRSTLGEYWLASVNFSTIRMQSRPVRNCGVIPGADQFKR